MIIDAHLHLWKKIDGVVNNAAVRPLENGKCDFGGEIRQMMPPYMEDGCNTIERLIANMDYAGVNACVVTQEYIDGIQDDYLLEAKAKYPNRVKICSLYTDEAFWNTKPRAVDSICEKKNAGLIRESEGNCINVPMARREETTDSLSNDVNFAYTKNDENSSREEKNSFGTEGFDGIKICAGRLKDKNLRNHLTVFETAERNGQFISIDMADGDEQTAGLQWIIDRCPSLRIAVGHFGMVTTKGWQKQIELAKNPNVYIESGGLTWLFNYEFYPYPSAIDAILEAKEICGIEKLMWGSDYPRTMTDITYKSALRFIKESAKLTAADKKAFLGENAIRFYGFEKMKPLEPITNML